MSRFRHKKLLWDVSSKKLGFTQRLTSSERSICLSKWPCRKGSSLSATPTRDSCRLNFYFTVWPYFDWRLIFNFNRKIKQKNVTEWDRCLWLRFNLCKKDYPWSPEKFVPQVIQIFFAGCFKITLSWYIFIPSRTFRVIMIHFHPNSAWLHFNACFFSSTGCLLHDDVKCLRFICEKFTFHSSKKGKHSITDFTTTLRWKKAQNLPILIQIFSTLLRAQTHGYPFSITLVLNNSTNCPFFWCFKRRLYSV